MSKRWKKWLPGYLFMLPALIFFVGFVLVPLVQAFFMSFQNITLQKRSWAGLDNYITLFRDPVFRRSLLNTILIALMNVPAVVLFSFFVANVVYNKSAVLRSFVRGAFYLPAVSSIVSISLVWTYIYNPNFGLISYLAERLGLGSVSLLSSPLTALPALTIIQFTLTLGQPVILYIAARGNLPASYIEASEIDGVSKWQQTIHIVWPLLKPTTLYIIIITTINSFQTFAIVKLITSGGPFHATSTIVFQLYKSAFEQGRFGLADAMGIILTIMVGVISLLQYTSLSSDVTY